MKASNASNLPSIAVDAIEDVAVVVSTKDQLARGAFEATGNVLSASALDDVWRMLIAARTAPLHEAIS